MRYAYTDKLSLNKENKIRLETINEICNEYVADGYVLTLRQLYYQLVSRDIVPNNSKEYAKLSNLLKKGRMAGIIDWNAIMDRGRLPKLPYSVKDIPDALQDTLEQYRLNRQENQNTYIEVWVEKDALSNIFLRVTEPYHIRLMVNKGYSSCSAMHDAALRIQTAMYKSGGARNAVILYFGDHDPSGLDMVRDIRERLEEFHCKNFDVLHPALNMDQVRRFNCPENPAKFSDPRASWYVREFGTKSWELDALPPKELIKIIESAVLEHLHKPTFDQVVHRETKEKAIIQDYINNF